MRRFASPLDNGSILASNPGVPMFFNIARKNHVFQCYIHVQCWKTWEGLGTWLGCTTNTFVHTTDQSRPFKTYCITYLLPSGLWHSLYKIIVILKNISTYRFNCKNLQTTSFPKFALNRFAKINLHVLYSMVWGQQLLDSQFGLTRVKHNHKTMHLKPILR